MDRDAASLAPPGSPADAVPPYPVASVRTTGLVGVGLTALAALLGLIALGVPDSAAGVLNTARLLLVLVGVVTAGAAVALRPDLWWSWGLGATAALTAWAGLPAHWDSFRLLAVVLAVVAAVGGVFALCSTWWRLVIASALILYHFGGIFLATTSPPPTPWVTDQLFRHVYNPYLQFIYMRNAYHFYSPEPGPASLLAFLLKTETGTDPSTGATLYKYEWIVLPTRPADLRDPLGLGYYRRLSLTEQLARGSPGLLIPTDQFEKTEMWHRRFNQQHLYPFHPVDNRNLQYKLPNSEVSRYLIPSYASHVILQHTPDKETAARTTVKVYRLEHEMLPVEQFVKRLPGGVYMSPYEPVTYRPFFLGEFGYRPDPADPARVRIELLNPQEALLYWLIPVLPADPNDPVSNPYKKNYIDYMSAHALDLSPAEVLAADEKAGRVFNWSQLR